MKAYPLLEYQSHLHGFMGQAVHRKAQPTGMPDDKELCSKLQRLLYLAQQLPGRFHEVCVDYRKTTLIGNTSLTRLNHILTI